MVCVCVKYCINNRVKKQPSNLGRSVPSEQYSTSLQGLPHASTKNHRATFMLPEEEETHTIIRRVEKKVLYVTCIFWNGPPFPPPPPTPPLQCQFNL